LRENGKTRRITLGKLDRMTPEAARALQHETMMQGVGASPAPSRALLTFNELASAFHNDKRGIYRAWQICS